MARHRNNKANQPAAETSWDPVAKWYKRWAGLDGSAHHRHLAIPAALGLLQARPGETVLDIGCGTGVLAPHIAAAGASYIGVDAGNKLLTYARKRHGQSGTFLHGDARRLPTLRGLRRAGADAAVFLLSIQDIDSLDAAFASAAWAVRPQGRIVILMTHPCFRVPRQSGWGWDANRKLTYRRVDRYLSSLAVPVRAAQDGTGTSIRSFHRPLQAYCNSLARHGFFVDHMTEIPTTPQALGRPGGGKAKRVHNDDIPVFLGLRARGMGG